MNKRQGHAVGGIFLAEDWN